MARNTKLSAMSDHELAAFRTTLCDSNQTGSCKDADRCPNSHCLTWQRRNPYEISYAPKLCPDIQFVKKGSKMSLIRRCNRGRHCQYAHSKEEELYHPMTYKTKMCSIAPTCTRFFCPFAHSAEEVRGRAKFRFTKQSEFPEKPPARHIPDIETGLELHQFACNSLLSNSLSPPKLWDSILRPVENQSWSEGSTASTGNQIGTESISSESVSPSPSLQGNVPSVETTLVKVACALLSSASTSTTDDKYECVSTRSSGLDTAQGAFFPQQDYPTSQPLWNSTEDIQSHDTQIADLVVSIAGCLSQGWQAPSSVPENVDTASDPKLLNELALAITKCFQNSQEGLAFDQPSEPWGFTSPYRMDGLMAHQSVRHSAPSVDDGRLNASTIKAPDFFNIPCVPNPFPFMDNLDPSPYNFQELPVAQDADYDRLWTEISKWCDSGRSERHLA